MLKTEGKALSFQHLPRDLANINALKNMLHKFNDIHVFNYIYKKVALYFAAISVNRWLGVFIYICVPGPIYIHAQY